MKKLKKINTIYKVFFAVALFLSAFVSCADLGDDPKKFRPVPDGFFSSAKDVETVVSSAFSKYHVTYKTAHSFVPFTGSDDITTHKASNKADFREFDTYNASPANNWLAEWKWDPLWATILSANATINGWPNVEGTTEHIDTKIKPIAAMAYYIRAQAYFDLVRIWGDLPLITDLATTTGKESRSPVADIYALIIADLEFAETYLPDSWVAEGSGIGKPTKMAAKALLARVYLTNAGWPLKDASKYAVAAAKAKEVIDSGNYTLEPEFKNLWVEENGSINEAIFVIRMCDPCANVPGAWANGGKSNFLKVGFAAAENGGGFEDVLAEIQFFKDFPAGPRKDATYYDNVKGKPWQELASGRPLFAKYGPNLGSIWQKTNEDIYISRYADVLLMFAEAENKATGTVSAEAYQAINAVRTRAGLTDLTGLSSDDFHKAVIAERGWEFAAEHNSRWFDLIRNELVEEAAAHRDPDENGFGAVITKDNYLAPLPAKDIALNPNLKQNPGY